MIKSYTIFEMQDGSSLTEHIFVFERDSDIFADDIYSARYLKPEVKKWLDENIGRQDKAWRYSPIWLALRVYDADHALLIKLQFGGR